jgi:cytochrome c-type biogenesis protein CcsB
MKYIKFLFSPLLMGVLFLVFAIAMAVATFLENDFGSAAAYNMVYNAKWFELILFLLAVNLVGQVIVLKLLRKEKLTVALFHLSFIVMIIGAGITRYFGWEGSMHIREGEVQQQCFSNEKYIGYSVKDVRGSIVANRIDKYSLTSVSADNYTREFRVNGQKYELILAKIIPNASEIVHDIPEGEPIVSMLVTKNMMSVETITLKKGETKTSEGITFSFESVIPADINISFDSGRFYAVSRLNLSETSMATQQVILTEPGKRIELRKLQILTLGELKIVPQQISASGIIDAIGVKQEEQTTGLNAFIFHLINGKKSETVYLWDREGEKSATTLCELDGNTVELSYGSKTTVLPFSIKLNKFILERYPGSTSPSGYKSDVILIDKKENVEKSFMIFMNNILKYKGYRFYQSSFDRDEKGTVLSVNHDMAGMVVTYTGYGLLFLFIILSMLNKNSLFYKINFGHWNSSIRKTIPVFLLIILLSGLSDIDAQKLIPNKSSAGEFGKVLVQDQKGRTKPLFTLSNDILRKVTRENEFEGLSSMQVFLGIYLDFNNWKDVPLIRISDSNIQRKLGISGKFASFTDLVDIKGTGAYKISGEVNEAYSKAPSDRSKTDKELMKVDERVNIVYMIYKGDFMKLFPLKDGTHNWGSPLEAVQKASGKEDSVYLSSIIPVLSEALQNNNVSAVHQVTGSIAGYQKKFSQYSLPSESKTNAELLYYKLGIFERLFPYYSTLGLIMLIGLITMVISGRKGITLFVKILGWLLLAGFLFHTLGLGLRWYIAGHAPMSNGYESMTFISWAIVLAGFIFTRKSPFALSAAAVLAGMTLMVAHMSFMDPEITNLVPVLKSYWLTLHVSVIISSDGFLGVGAILSLINLILLSLSNDKNRERISDTIDELTVINFRILTIGLYLLTIGTFLGAVWANESWGRYWGWDPKETWSLITIIIYSIVIHSRRIPGMKDIFTFNLISLFAFSSVLMTYFGVNYYLSGMHSYASGDSVPVPSFVYIAVIVLAAISLLAYTKYRRPDHINKKSA